MAGFIVAIRGTPAQATLLGVSTAVGHTIIVWGLAILGLWLGNANILDTAEPWLMFASGGLIILLGLRLIVIMRRTGPGRHQHDHHHPHDHAHPHTHQSDPAKQATATARQLRWWEIAWFGFTGGLLPCPSAVAVLLICLQLGAFSLGVLMVAAFSLGLAVTMVSVGIAAAWGARTAMARWPRFSEWATRLPYISAAIVIAIGLAITVRSILDLTAA